LGFGGVVDGLTGLDFFAEGAVGYSLVPMSILFAPR